MLGAGGPGENRQEQFRRFLQLVSRGDGADKALENAFGMSVAVAEAGLEDYVRRGNHRATRRHWQQRTGLYLIHRNQRSSLSEGEANYYLGDLLLHLGREQDAERYFKQAIALEPGFTPAYASLGQLSVQQQRYAEAKKYLQRATTSPQSYRIHYLYAYALSREGVNSTGQVSGYSREMFRGDARAVAALDQARAGLCTGVVPAGSGGPGS